MARNARLHCPPNAIRRLIFSRNRENVKSAATSTVCNVDLATAVVHMICVRVYLHVRQKSNEKSKERRAIIHGICMRWTCCCNKMAGMEFIHWIFDEHMGKRTSIDATHIFNQFKCVSVCLCVPSIQVAKSISNLFFAKIKQAMDSLANNRPAGFILSFLFCYFTLHQFPAAWVLHTEKKQTPNVRITQKTKREQTFRIEWQKVWLSFESKFELVSL